MCACACLCVCACVSACACVCACACVHACACVRAWRRRGRRIGIVFAQHPAPAGGAALIRVEQVVANVRRHAVAHGLPPDKLEKLWRKLIDWSIEREEDHLRKG